jgi:hypothetical protein
MSLLGLRYALLAVAAFLRALDRGVRAPRGEAPGGRQRASESARHSPTDAPTQVSPRF